METSHNRPRKQGRCLCQWQAYEIHQAQTLAGKRAIASPPAYGIPHTSIERHLYPAILPSSCYFSKEARSSQLPAATGSYQGWSRQTEKSNELVGNRNSDLLAPSTVLQPTRLPRSPLNTIGMGGRDGHVA
jgi:hypothetical protein